MRNRGVILRKAQLRNELEPEKAEKAKKYQKKYNLEHRKAILEEKRRQYLEKKAKV
jgi:hypothetical protein